MTTKPLPPKLPPRNGGPSSPATAPATAPATPQSFNVSSGRLAMPQRVVLYGTGGIGKSSLSALAPNPVFLDLESGTDEMDVQRIPITDWQGLRDCLRSDILDPFQTIVIDGGTKAEELATVWTLDNVPHEKGHRVDRLEDYNFGKGLAHVYETYLLLLQDLDGQVRKGRNVILIAHDCISEVPNPVGENWIRYEPHLQSPKSGKNSIRNRVVQWASHVLFLGYDVVASKQGKGQGGGTRTIWTQELPSHIAKTRGAFNAADEVPLALPFNKGDGTIWNLILGESKS